MEDSNLRGENQNFGCVNGNPAMCMTCKNSHGEPPWADAPTKSYCIAYTRESGMRKPPAVYYGGADCEFYRGE